MSKLEKFYDNKIPNGDGLYLKEMWDFNDWQIENTHHFIQWLFPISFKSNHCDDAPIVTAKEVEKLTRSEDFRHKLLKSLAMMENFWGFDVEHASTIAKPKSFRSFLNKEWFTPYNHNFIRISRVLQSLVLFGLDKEAQELLDYLENNVYTNYKHIIGEENLEMWKMAVQVRKVAA